MAEPSFSTCRRASGGRSKPSSRHSESAYAPRRSGRFSCTGQEAMREAAAIALAFRQSRSAAPGPHEIGAQTVMDGASISRPGHHDTDSPLLVIQHDRRAADFTHAQLQRAARVLIIEGHALQAARTGNGEVAVLEEHNVGRRLPGDALADRTMTGVIIDRISIGMRLMMRASTGVLVCHELSPATVIRKRNRA